MRWSLILFACTLCICVGPGEAFLNAVPSPRHGAVSSQLSRSRHRGNVLCASPSVSNTSPELDRLADSLLDAVDKTFQGKGRNVRPRSVEEQEAVDRHFTALSTKAEETGASKESLKTEDVFGFSSVVYEAAARGDFPAGGRWRTGFLGLLFRLTGLYQAVLPPFPETSAEVAESETKNQTNQISLLMASLGVTPGSADERVVKDRRPLVVNVLTFRLFWFLWGAVTLVGRLEVPSEDLSSPPPASSGAETETEGKTGAVKKEERRKFAQVFFGPARICLLHHWLGFSLGGESSVGLWTPFANGRLRLGIGSRGTKFVFKRLSEEELRPVLPLCRFLMRKAAKARPS
uniref:Transmembrane protein n=1 Tax=Chromera velia CCMP2878 TaxID=1169474 RepID=A0A0G4IDN5_9ALVE|eukprot:Cvel_13431.t1-p1 / transcript=Cvel_13431.t1 / gene=Cvel_13431 / organism=Chromera_velia_CCMP2878 / gene_product=hypothetical protein / transcript_product=hypothetical protein / location=Cvel_scaffold916:37678-40807(+) / protein_length=346 / sequence_SO=supercontig / SO=protein_coding / is_pseudo=false